MARFKKCDRIFAYILGSAPTAKEEAFLKEIGPLKGGVLRLRNASVWQEEVERVAPGGGTGPPLYGPAFVPDPKEMDHMMPAAIIVHRNDRGKDIAEHYRHPYGNSFKVIYFETEGEPIKGDEPAQVENPRTVRELKSWLDRKGIHYGSTAKKPELMRLYANALEE